MEFIYFFVHLLRISTTKHSKAVKLQIKLYFSYHPTESHSSVYRQSQHKVIIYQNS